eukprot:gene11643-11788_t
MKLFVDSTDIEEIKEAVSWGVVDGVTTNPSLVMKSGKDFKTLANEIFEILPDGEISLEVVSVTAEDMVREGRKLIFWQPKTIVKIPMTLEGLKAISTLSKEGIKTNCTLVFSANQALMAARAGAYLVSPFVGRLDDIGHDGMQLIRDIVQIYKEHNIQTRVLSASIRHPAHAFESAKAGAYAGTMPFKVMKQMASHVLTDKGLQAFVDDWEKAKAQQTSQL